MLPAYSHKPNANLWVDRVRYADVAELSVEATPPENASSLLAINQELPQPHFDQRTCHIGAHTLLLSLHYPAPLPLLWLPASKLGYLFKIKAIVMLVLSLAIYIWAVVAGEISTPHTVSETLYLTI